MQKQFPNVEIHVREYQSTDLDDCDLVIAAVNDIPTSELIRNHAKQKEN